MARERIAANYSIALCTRPAPIFRPTPPNAKRPVKTGTNPKAKETAVGLAALDGKVFGATSNAGRVIERYVVCEAIAHCLIGQSGTSTLGATY